MTKKKRIAIPPEVSGAVMFDADLTCCICEVRDKPLQIHHIDGNPSNNASSNLVPLCLDHHDKASSKSTISRSLNPNTISRYRESWFSRVRQRREISNSRTPENTNAHEAMLEALACHDIRRITFRLGWKWEDTREALNELAPYSDPWNYGIYVRKEILTAMYHLACSTRHDMPVDIATRVSHLATNMLPIVSLVAPTDKVLTADQQYLLKLGIALGHAMAYDGIKYRKKLSIISEGSRVLWTILRFSRLNELKELRSSSNGEFEGLMKTADEFGNPKARKWLEFQRDDALALDGEPLPDLPQELLAEIHSA